MRTSILIFIFFLLSAEFLAQPITNSEFSETEISLETNTGILYGTMIVADSTEATPIILIIAGSGPTDRNGNAGMRLQTNAYKFLSEDIAKKGISSLRFDKRAIGQSRPAATNEADLRFETYINDVLDWISLLKADKRFSEIILLGHSEGSLIGMIAAQKTEVDGYISVSGPGQSADKVLQAQLEGKLPPQLQDQSDSILLSLKQGKTVSEVNPNLAVLYRSGVQPYLISWMQYDPAQEIKKLSIPVLIIQGTSDLQVPLSEAKLLSAAKPDAELLIIENMNHVLKDSDKDLQKNIATYLNPSLPLKAGLVDDIINFIKISSH